MAGYTQTKRILQLHSPLGANALLPTAFQGTEEISELFDYQIEVLAEPETAVQPAALIGKRITVELEVTDTGDKRYFNGIVASLESTGGDSFFSSYRIRMVPMLWLLSLNQQTRVFQDMTVLDIAQKVLAPYSIVPRIETKGTYQTLEYCTQYRETDLAFLERLLQQQGIFFYFTHSSADHVLVLTDTSSLCTECPIVSDFEFMLEAEQQLNFYKPLILSFHSRAALISGEHTTWDYSFMQYAPSQATPGTTHSSVEMGENSHEYYDYSDAASSPFKTEGAEAKTILLQTQLQKVLSEIGDAQAVRCGGESTASTMQAGFSFKLDKYPQADKNGKYLITKVTHSIQQQPGYRAEVTAPDITPYLNQFEARPFTQVYRKEQQRPKPRVHGVVTGKVVTYPGEDSYLDRFGRVCVQFWWDRHRPSSSPDKTLLRVAQQWAGSGWGSYFWPRVGDEVLIDFIEGDPDAPIVVGSLYNGINLPKYDPHTKYTLSGIATRSSKGGGVSNAGELRFDDRKGAEQVYLNAERDFELHVEHDWHTLVDQEEHKYVRKDQYQRVDGASHLQVKKEQLLEIGEKQQVVIRGEQHTDIGGSYLLNVSQSQTIRSGLAHRIEAEGQINLKSIGNIAIEAGIGGICLRSAESAISIDATGITFQGPVHFGMATCVPPLPDLNESSMQSLSSPVWPGDHPLGE
jgi:type VI secretion system secreted protein VgrG